MTTGSPIDLDALADSIDNQSKHKLYSCTYELEDHPDICGIFFNDLRTHYNLPLTVQDVNDICSMAMKEELCLKSTSKPCVIGANLLHILSSTKSGLRNVTDSLIAQVMRELFQIDLNLVILPVKAELDSFVVCKSGESFVGSFYQDLPGKFGSLLLSIPLRDGCEGKVTINYGSEQTTYNFESAGNKGNFVISAMAGTYHLNHVQDYTVESTSVMPVAFMVFHLIWTGSAELSNYMGSDELPCFLSSVTNAHQALSAWKTPPSVSREKPLELAPSFQLDQATNSLALDTSVPEQSACKKTEAENGAVKEVGLPFQTIATNVSDGIIVEPRYDSSELDQSKDEPLKEIIMANHALVCYPLTGCYTISKFSASSLKGEDVFTYHVFNSLSYVDVSLGVIVLLDHDDPDVNCCCCYADVIASTKCSRYHSLLLWDVEFKSFSKLTHLDVDKTVVGELGGSMNTDINTRSTLTPSFPASHCDAHQLRHSVPCVNAGKVPGKTFHPVVIIQPKWLVYPQHPKLHFNPALNSLQSRWQDAHRHFLSGDSTLRNHLVADIGRLVAFAFSPLAELVPNYCRVVFNVHYLLEHCLRFRAKDEGLLVLNFVAHKQCPCGMHDFNSELTTDSSLLLMIADFALQVAGWQVCSETVLRLINNHKLNNNYLDMARHLMQRHCEVGAVQIADKILDKMNEMKTASLDHYPVKFLARVTLFLDELNATVHLDVSKRLSIARCCMETLAPARLLKELEEFVDRIDEPGILRETFDHLAPLVLNAELRDINEHDFFKLLRARSLCENTDLLNELWTKVRDEFKHPVNMPFDSNSESTLPMIHRLVMNVRSSCKRIAMLESMSGLGVSHEILDGLVGVHFKSLMESSLIESYAPYYMFVCLAENDEKLMKHGRIDAFCSHFKEWSDSDLCQLIVGLFDADKRNLKKRRSSSEMYRKLLSELIERDMIFIMRAGKMFPQVVRCLLWFEDFALIKRFVARINEDREKNADADSLKTFYEKVPEIFSIPGVFGDVMSDFYCKLDRKHAMSLIDTWLRAAMALAQLDRSYIEKDKVFLYQMYLSYIKAEKYLPSDSDVGVHSLFTLFLNNLGFQALLPLVILVCESEIINDGLGLKKFTTAFQNFKVLIYGLTYGLDFQNIVSVVQDSTSAKRLVRGLFWVGDEEFLSKLLKALSSCPIQHQRLPAFLQAIVECEQTLDVALKTPNIGLKYFNLMIERYVEVIHLKLKPTYTWCLHGVKSNCPVIQKFLISNEEAILFKGKLRQGTTVDPPNVLAYNWVNVGGLKSFRVSKIRQYVIPPPDALDSQTKLATVEEIRKKILAHQDKLQVLPKENETRDSVPLENVEIICSIAKRRKIDSALVTVD